MSHMEKRWLKESPKHQQTPDLLMNEKDQCLWTSCLVLHIQIFLTEKTVSGVGWRRRTRMSKAADCTYRRHLREMGWWDGASWPTAPQTWCPCPEAPACMTVSPHRQGRWWPRTDWTLNSWAALRMTSCRLLDIWKTQRQCGTSVNTRPNKGMQNWHCRTHAQKRKEKNKRDEFIVCCYFW